MGFFTKCSMFRRSIPLKILAPLLLSAHFKRNKKETRALEEQETRIDYICEKIQTKK